MLSSTFHSNFIVACLQVRVCRQRFSGISVVSQLTDIVCHRRLKAIILGQNIYRTICKDVGIRDFAGMKESIIF